MKNIEWVQPDSVPSEPRTPRVHRAPTEADRRHAIDQAKANNALSGFTPSDFGLSVFERWIAGELNTQQAVDAIKAHYRANPVPDDQSDQHAPQNLPGITDSRQLRLFEADVTTLRMAELKVDPV